MARPHLEFDQHGRHTVNPAHGRPGRHAPERRRKRKMGCNIAVATHDLAEWTGLEPATPGVTGRYSNQLNYHSTWRLAPGSARGGCERVALAV